jgi:hypothetical protein
MTANNMLEIFLLFDVFLIGAVVALAVQHAYARTPKRAAEKAAAEPVPAETLQLPPEVRERLIEASKANFKFALERSAVELQHELKSTTLQLNYQLGKLGREIFAHEMERYRLELEQLRKRADIVIGGAQSEIAEHQAQLRIRLAEEMMAEKQHFIAQFDTKLADAMAAFLIETLGHDVDLGAQMPYVIAMLDEHKAEIMKGVSE